MKIAIHRNKLRFVLYIKLTCTWFKICILICCVCVIVQFYYKRNTANSLPLYIIKQMHAWNEQILKFKLKLAACCAVSRCWPSCFVFVTVQCKILYVSMAKGRVKKISYPCPDYVVMIHIPLPAYVLSSSHQPTGRCPPAAPGCGQWQGQ